MMLLVFYESIVVSRKSGKFREPIFVAKMTILIVSFGLLLWFILGINVLPVVRWLMQFLILLVASSFIIVHIILSKFRNIEKRAYAYCFFEIFVYLFFYEFLGRRTALFPIDSSFRFFMHSFFYVLVLTTALHIPIMQYVEFERELEKRNAELQETGIMVRNLLYDRGIDWSTLGLSQREQEIASLLVTGLSYKEIAGKLYISLATVKTHVMRIYQKTGSKTRMDLLRRLKRENPDTV
jgi:DNA-binding CsgD family transcriptional regulator